ncbi:MAG: leucine-rich repeat domain-containing protein, partial [Syntrophomonadaceae bacterium]|nr:leucine-rich repeat domain-containing protein [Syntrophomonadaceae bacterium]
MKRVAGAAPRFTARCAAFLLIIALLLGIAPIVSAGDIIIITVDSTVESNPHKFTSDDNVLTKYEGPGGALEIPASITAVGDAVFRDNKVISSISFESDSQLMKIGKNSFRGISVTSIVFPDLLEEIGDYAFYQCTNLELLTLPNSLKTIGLSAFNGCTKLGELSLPSGLTTIGASFIAGTSITSIEIPASVTDLPVTSNMSAFANCLTLENAVFLCDKTTGKPGITAFPAGLFYSCVSLNEIAIPEGITDIGSYAFYVCGALKTVKFPKDSLISIGGTVFSGCRSLVEIEIPNSVKQIAGSVFQNCTNLETVTFCSDVFSGYSSGFANMFSTCPKLKSVSFPGISGDTTASGTFINGSADKAVGDKSTTVYSLIRSVTFPAEVTGLGTTSTTVTAVFDKPDFMEELVLLQPLNLRLGNRLFMHFAETDTIKNPLKRIVIMADNTELKITDSFYHNTYNYAGQSASNQNTYSNRSPIHGIPRDTEIYVKPNSVTYQELVKNVEILNTYSNDYKSNKWTPNFIFLTQPITITAQDVASGTDLMFPAATIDTSYDSATAHEYPSGKDAFSDGGMTAEIPEGVLRPYQISGFDALVAIHAEKYGWEEKSGGEQLVVDSGSGVITTAFGKNAATLAL